MSVYDDWKSAEPDDILPHSADECPKCGAELIHGYGIMGGGIGAYALCDNADCDYFDKTQDGDES